VEESDSLERVMGMGFDEAKRRKRAINAFIRNMVVGRVTNQAGAANAEKVASIIR
jgi:hypothetical protein